MKVDVYDRWHKAPSEDQDSVCSDHKKPVSSRHGKGKRWQVRYREADGKQRTLTFERIGEANRKAAELEADSNKGRYIDPSAGKLALRTYALQHFLPNHAHVRPNTVDSYTSYLNTHIIPALGGRAINAIRRADAKAFVATLRGKRLAPATITTIFAILRAMMQTAVDDELIATNPCARIKLPKIEQRVLRPLTADQVRAAADAIQPRLRITVWLAAGAGLRGGEIFGLTADRIRRSERRLLVEEQMQDGEFSPLKTTSSRRVVPLDAIIFEAIDDHIRQFPTMDGLLINNSIGKPVKRSAFSTAWRLAVAKADLPKGTRFHDLRHFFASTLIAAGVNPKTLQNRMGHATISETMDTYGHLFDDHEDHGRGALDSAFA